MKSFRTIARLLVLPLLLLCLATPSFAEYAENSSTFSDVPTNHWAYPAITWMASHGILNGVGDGKFNPGATVTREQFARMMVSALQLNVGESYTPSFSDVPASAWSFRFVEAAKPYLTGYDVPGSSLDQFHPKEAAVREDMAVALVKALGFQSETPDLTVLEPLADYPAAEAGKGISPNLVNYAAIAVKHGILKGVARNGGLYFDAQESLSRAAASVLVFNALGVAGVKVTYDDLPKVTYDVPTPTPTASTNPASTTGPTVLTSVSGNKITASWSKSTAADFQGYKVVLSREDSSPAYPENGYLKWITNRDTISCEIYAGLSYNGGDVGGTLQAGSKYYLSITAVTGSGKYPGNTVQVTMPAAPAAPVTTALPTATIGKTLLAEGVKLSWTKISDERFQGYKVVLSDSDSDPRYPEDGYFQWITDASQTSVSIYPGNGYNGDNDFGGEFKSGVTYYARITALFEGGKSYGNVITFTMP